MTFPISDEQTKKDLYASIPPYQRDARSKGIPQLGSGAIYPVRESEIVRKPFEIPRYWPRCYALDVGWNRTAAVWGASPWITRNCRRCAGVGVGNGGKAVIQATDPGVRKREPVST